MVQRSKSFWLYQKLALIVLAITFTVYSFLLRISVYLITMVLLCIVPGILSPRYTCRTISFTKHIYFNYCGAFLPLLVAIVILVQNIVPWHCILLMTSLSIVLSTLHTYLSSKYILVNVPRYLITITSIALVLLDLDTIYSLLPFTIVVGLLVGADIFSYLAISIMSKNKKRVILGGFMALDSIPLTLTFSLIILIIVRILSAT